MTIHKKGQAHWEGDIKRGKGTVSTESGVLNQQPYGFNTRFEGAQGTNLLSPQRAVDHVCGYCRGLLFRLKICSPCCFIHQTSKSVNVNINNSHIAEGDLYS